MVRITFIDLQILHLGIKRKGCFNERDLENSDLKKLGVGKILDHLASLKERNLVIMNNDGSFSITESAKHILWDTSIPLWIKILRILEIKSQDLGKISAFLLLPPEKIEPEIEDLRKRQLVLMSPLRIEMGILKMYEILPEGIEQIKKSQNNLNTDKPNFVKSQLEILSLIDEVISDIKDNELPKEKKEKLISKISQIKEKLEI